MTTEASGWTGGHTPGPWSWWTSNSVLRLSSDATRKDGDVLHAVVHRNFADVVCSEADRNLIAAAPDLYEALAEAVEWMDVTNGYVQTMDSNFDNAPLTKARAALSRAEGEG